ncbi:hypothetical protein F8S13_22410 [Chloroflexia bacterium SDU3-3]|nr:hypothetical protein F8S13_22410 [Chloroflexia bacterium SDU3-3]
MPHPLAYDTSPAAEARQIAFFQQRTPTERLGISCELTAFAFVYSRAAVRRLHPHLDPLAQERRFAQLAYGPAHADRLLQAPTIEGS